MRNHLFSKRPWLVVRSLSVVAFLLFQTTFVKSVPVYAQSSAVETVKSELVQPAAVDPAAAIQATPVPGDVVTAAITPAAVPNFQADLVKTTDMSTISPPSPDPSGITYLPGRNTLLVSDGEVEETVNGITHFQKANIWEMNLNGTVKRTANISSIGSAPVPVTNEPTGVALNPNNGHLYFTDDAKLAVYDVNVGSDGLIGTADDTFTTFSTDAGNGDPEGITYDTRNNRLFVADGINKEIYEYSLSGTLISHFDVGVIGAKDPETVEYNPDSDTLFVMNSNAANIRIFEISTSGTLLRTISTTIPGLAPAGLAYAPASDGSGVKHFYVVDRGIDNNVDPNIVDGLLHEITAPEPLRISNTPPTVSAGSDKAINLSGGTASVSLNATAGDDGLPNPPAQLTYAWSKVSGPGTVSFTNAGAVDTTATFTTAGTYVLRLTVGDSELSATDDVTVTVNGEPVVNAGADVNTALDKQGEANITLSGSVSDEGLPNPPGSVTVTWSKVSGPGSVTFGNSHAVDSTATFTTEGTYVLRLSADDGALSASGEVTVMVAAAAVFNNFIYIPMLAKQPEPGIP